MMMTFVITLVFANAHLQAQMFAERIENDYAISYKVNQINQYIATKAPELRGQLLYDRLAYDRLYVKEDSILVSFIIEEQRDFEVLDMINQSGATFHQVLQGDIYYAGFVQIDSLLRFPSLFPDTRIRMNLMFDLPANDEQGPDRINSVTYETGGAIPNAGNGITIAILDSGWDAYTNARNDGLVPEVFNYFTCTSGLCFPAVIPGGNAGCTSNNGCAGHGTRTVQTVFHHAPAANYIIYDTPNTVARAAAIQHATGLGVDVITCSQSGYNTGWDDNSGILCGAVNAPSANHILMFFSAGNRNGTGAAGRNGSHWQGNFNSNANAFHRWQGNDIVNNRTNALQPDANFHVNIQCDNDGGWINRYEVQIINTNNNNVLANEFFATATTVSWTNNQNNSVNVGIRVRALTSFTPEFEMWTHNAGQYQYFSTSNQTSSPANCTNNVRMLAVAAVDQADFDQSDPNTMWYSSSGPTNNNNFSVMITGPTETNVAFYTSTGTQVMGTYGGTSAATPNVAGAAAAFWSKHQGLTATHVRNILIHKAFNYKDWGPSGYDNNFGWGGAYLFSFNSTNIYLHQISGNSGFPPSNGVYPWYSLKDINNMAPNNRNVIMLNHDSETAPFTITKSMTINAVGNPNTSKRIE